MQPSLPIPTDNIYKFCCLFGLTLIVVTVFSFSSVYTASLDRAVSYAEIVIPLEAKESRTKAEDETLNLNKKLIDVTTANKKFALNALVVLCGVGFFISGIGGFCWYDKIQRRDDKLAELQLRKLELEVAKLQPLSETKSD